MADKIETMILVNARGIKLGACVHYPAQGGWKFIPNTTSRSTSRKYWPTATTCIPKWAFDASDNLLTSSEYRAKMALA